MTDEERDIITRFIERVSGASHPATGSVPATIPALPPVDPAADQLIGEQFQRYPEARYRLTQTAFVQEHALAEAQNRIAQLQTELEQARTAQTSQPAAPAAGGGFFHNLFGAGQSQSPAQPQAQPYAPQPYAQMPPPPQYQQSYAQPQYAPPGYQPGMFQRQGSGFLGSALTTAAGVAGGLVAGNALMNLFEGNRGYGQGFGGGGWGNPGFGGNEPGAWGGESPAPPDAQVTGSAWDNQVETAQPTGWDNTGGGNDGGGWDQASNDAPDPGQDSGGGWDDSSNGS